LFSQRTPTLCKDLRSKGFEKIIIPSNHLSLSFRSSITYIINLSPADWVSVTSLLLLFPSVDDFPSPMVIQSYKREFTHRYRSCRGFPINFSCLKGRTFLFLSQLFFPPPEQTPLIRAISYRGNSSPGPNPPLPGIGLAIEILLYFTFFRHVEDKPI